MQIYMYTVYILLQNKSEDDKEYQCLYFGFV